jgi:hypothetical protein
MEKKPDTKRKVRYIDFDGGRDYRAWLTEKFPSKMDQPPAPNEVEDTPDTEA